MREKWSPAWFYIDRGFYHRQLKTYYEFFDSKLIHVILYEDFTKDLRQTLQGIFDFLNVDTGFCVDSNLKHNASDEGSVPRSMFLYSLVAWPNWLSTVTRAVLPKRSLGRLRPIVKGILTKKKCVQEMAPLTDGTRRDLTNVFREDILQLQDLIRKDLSSWL
jgi:hypothetical protein